ncbi:anthrone oxygenase family protein [uncultured Sulfitobacter sp.]|uniref:anthrone oxygenase family protein n=1 Tax=uncultured Sulfitobacter sp. TaxID=191468 RepID=UPI002635C21D|nr:anthrone oxygenase family protein [uncultured Sulfitobacter sp.]
MPNKFTRLLIFTSMLSSAAIFGFFYAWTCSTMWGLDSTDPRVAIEAMQAMNTSVRNAVFAPAFFGTPILLAAAAVALWHGGFGRSASLFGFSALTYFGGGLLLTVFINVPMNEALGALNVPDDMAQAGEIWSAYSPTWQFWNQTRTIASAAAFLLALSGVFALTHNRNI